MLSGPSLAVAGSVYLPLVQAELDRSFFARAAHPGVVQSSRSAATAAAIGAAATVLECEFVPLLQAPGLPDGIVGSQSVPAHASG